MNVIVESNVDSWAEKLARVLDDFNFLSPADSGPLGDSIVRRVAHNISDRGLEQRRGIDAEFRENQHGYEERKVALYGIGAARPNIRTEQMLSQSSVEGEQALSGDARELTWTYGKGTTPTNGRTARDRATTDREKAHYAHEGQSKMGVVRPFFGLAPEDEMDASDLTEEALDRHLKGR